jgi:hypothetical protein
MSFQTKPYLFPSITVAVLGYAAYRVTKQQLDSGYFMLTDTSLYLLGDPGFTAADLAAAVVSFAEALTPAPEALVSANKADEVSSSQSPAASALAVATEAAPKVVSQAAQDEDIPPEFADLIKRRPEEYAAVVEAFRQAYAEGRVVAMKDVIWRNYVIVS